MTDEQATQIVRHLVIGWHGLVNCLHELNKAGMKFPEECLGILQRLQEPMREILEEQRSRV